MGESGRSAYNDIVVEPLREENHEDWFEWVRNYLIAQDLWEVVDRSSARPPEDEDHKKDFLRWKRKNATALHIIHISCNRHSFSHIRGVSEAKDAWHILNHTYNSPELEPEPTLEPEPESEPAPKLQPEPGPEPKPEPQVITVTEDPVDFDVADLYKAICDNEWSVAKAFLDEHPNALTSKLTSKGHTALHVAAQFGHVGIVKELVRLVSPQSLEIVNDKGFTPLATAARYSRDTRIAEYMVNKTRNTLGIPTKKKSLPVTLAFQSCGNKEMQRYLYSVTPMEYLIPEKGAQGPLLLHWCIIIGDLDVALHLLQQCEELLLAGNTRWGPIMKMAAMPSAFFSKSQLVFWKRWIYSYINIPSTTTNFVRVDVTPQIQEDERVQGLDLLRNFISSAYNLLGIKEIYELKLLHVRAAQILSLVCRNVPFLVTKKQDATDVILQALFRAAKEGNVEFVVQISKAYPQLILLHSKTSGWNAFFHAIENRQAEVFNLIHGLRFKDSLTSVIAGGRSMLHVAGNLAPSFQLNRISGPALQMQRELQWFKEVESVIPPGFKELHDHDGLQPKDIFKESHKELRKEGEKWMKEMASSGSVVAALVVTIMFAAAFTVTGGNNQEFGYPIFWKKTYLCFL